MIYFEFSIHVFLQANQHRNQNYNTQFTNNNSQIISTFVPEKDNNRTYKYSIPFQLKNNMHMEFLELAKNRYSCRNYQPTGVEREKMDYIMECVRMAPSAVNKQPWKFRIINSEEDRKRICQCYNREWFTTAPVVVIASVLHDEEWVRADGKHHGNIDIAIAVEHLCLAATELGLGTCWVCNFDDLLCKELFGLDNNEEAAVLIPLGYPADEPKEKKRKTMEEIVIQ